MEQRKQKILNKHFSPHDKPLKTLSPNVQINNFLSTDNAVKKIMKKSSSNQKYVVINPYKQSRKSAKQNNKKYIFNRTTFNTPFQKSAMLSYVSTPKQKSYKLSNMHSLVNTYEKIIKDQSSLNMTYSNFAPISPKNTRILESMKKIRAKQYQSTQQQNISENTIKINITLSPIYKRIITKYYNKYDRCQQISQDFLKQIQQQYDKIQNKFYGFLGFQSIPYQKLISQHLKTDTNLQELFKQNYKEITLQPILIKHKINYQNMQFKDFQVIKYLGSGGFSSVYLCKCSLDQQFCGLKFIKKDTITTSKKIKMLENQRNILFTIMHQNLIDLYYAFQTKNLIIFGLQYCSNGNLYNYLQKRKVLPEEQAKLIFKQILSGLEYLHENNILFRDVKLENILFDHNGKIKITDFGLSKPDVQDDQITYSYCGSPQYMAPEMLTKSGHSYSVDYYALGILLFELLFGRSPFYAPKKQDIFTAIINTQPIFPKNNISKQAKCLIKGLLTKNPKHRIGSLKGIKQICSHPWLRGYKVDYQSNQFQNILSVLHKNQGINKKMTQQDFLKIKETFQIQKTYTKYEKYFFDQSFVNRNLVEKIDKHIHIFKASKKNQKMVKGQGKQKKGLKFF